MKKLFILSLVALSTITVNAQRKKTRANTSQGNWALRVGAGYNANSYDRVGDENFKESTINFSPSIGYFIADNLEIGLDVDVNWNKEKSTSTSVNNVETTTTDLGFGIYGLKYFPVNNWFAFTGGLSLGLSNGNGKTVITSANPSLTNTVGKNAFGGAANFGLAFTPVNNLAIQANIIGLGAMSGTILNEGTIPDVNTTEFGLNVWRQPASVSMTWFFGRGMWGE
jgi:outer membrane protein